MMKKLLVILLLGCFLVTAAACSSRTSDGEKISTVKEGVLLLATNAEFPPFEYFEGTDILGFDIDIANEIASALGLTLQVENMVFDAVVTSVRSGRCDIAIAGLTVNEARLNEVDFSDSYYRSSQVIITPVSTSITSGDDLAGKTVGVQLGTTGDYEMSNGDYGAEVARYNKPSDAINDLKAGRLDAVVIDSNPAQVFVNMNQDTLALLEEPLTDEDYAIGVNKSNTALTAAINEVLAEMESSGKMAELKAKYYLYEASTD